MAPLSIIKWTSADLILAGKNRSGAEVIDLVSSEVWFRVLSSGFRSGSDSDSGLGSSLDSGLGSGLGLGLTLDWITWMFNFDQSCSSKSWSLMSFLSFCVSICVGRFLIFGAVSFFLVSSGSGLVGTNGSGRIEVGLTGCIKSPEASNAPWSLTVSSCMQDRD